MYIKTLVDEHKFYEISKSITKNLEASNAVFDYIEKYESDNKVIFIIDNEPMWFRTHYQTNNIIENVSRDEFEAMEDKDNYEIVYEDGNNLIVIDYEGLGNQAHIDSSGSLKGGLNEATNRRRNRKRTPLDKESVLKYAKGMRQKDRNIDFFDLAEMTAQRFNVDTDTGTSDEELKIIDIVVELYPELYKK